MLVLEASSWSVSWSIDFFAFWPSPVDGVPRSSMLDFSVSVAVWMPVFAWVAAASSELALVSPFTVLSTESSQVCTDEHTPLAQSSGEVVDEPDDDFAPVVVVDDAPVVVVVVCRVGRRREHGEDGERGDGGDELSLHVD